MEKYIGTIQWASDKESLIQGTISRAILTESNFNFDWHINNMAGGLRLISSDQINYAGEFSFREDDGEVKGNVTGRFYSNNNGCVLIGKWIEAGEHFLWVAELQPVNKFSDEK